MASQISCYSPTHGPSLADAYKAVDTEISRLELHLCSLRTYRNSLSPISKLPTELLSKVFHDTQRPTSSSYPKGVDVRTRFFVSWVCRHWRNTALITPDLWTIISKQTQDDEVDIDLVEELLRRSGNMPLTANLYNPSTDVLNVFALKMHRIQHLRLAAAVQHEDDINLFYEPAPLLSSLELVGVKLPFRPIFLGYHPQLRHTSVIDLYLPFPSTLIDLGLESLQMIDLGRTIDVNHLIELLPCLQNLSELVLTQCLAEYDVRPPANRIRLPSLKVLKLSDEKVDMMFSFLRCFDIPHTSIIVAWPDEVEYSPSMMEDFLYNLRVYLWSASFPVRHLHGIWDTPDLSINLSSSPSQNRHSFRFPTHLFDDGRTDALNAFVIPLYNLETLSLKDLPIKAFWDISRSPKLTSVTLYGMHSLTDFVWALGSDVGERKGRKVVQFPALRELRLCDVADEELDDLQQVLATRKSMGMGLEKLILVGCPDVDVSTFSFIHDSRHARW